MREKERKRNWKTKRKVETGQNVASLWKSMELSADRTEEEKNLWFLWFHQHD